MAITAQQVNELRKITGAGMMDCKKALVETNGDLEAAIDVLRKQGQKVAAKRADREASEGLVFSYTSDDHKEGLAFALNCETEPVSNTEDFRTLGSKILDVAIANKPKTAEDLVAMDVEGKPIADHIVELTGKIGEKIEVSHYAYATGESVISYLHGTKIAVLVTLANTGGEVFEETGKDVAMQIAAMKPVAVNESGVSAEVVEREKQVGIEKARQEGKPEHILEKIAEGFVKKFYQENTLLNQAFVKEPKQTVQQYLDSVKKGLTVVAFERVAIGR